MMYRDNTPLSRLMNLAIMQRASCKLVEATATGNPAAFETDVAKPLVGMTIPFTPQQAGSGDPSPSNVRAISGFTGVNIYRTGVNFCGCEWESGTINASSGEDYDDGTEKKRTKGYFAIVGGLTYNVVDESRYKRVYWYDKDKNYISSHTTSSTGKTAPSNACFARAVVESDKTPNPAETYSFNYPSTDTEYHAYTGNSYTVTFPDGQTIYGGTLDLVTGVLTVDRFGVTSDEIDAGDWAITAPSETLNRFSIGKEKLPHNPKNNSTSNLLCNWLKAQTGAVEWQAFIGSTGNFHCYVPSETIADKNAWATYLSQHKLTFVYELDEPYTIQLYTGTIQTLVGDNTLWTDTNGTNEITYLKKG